MTSTKTLRGLAIAALLATTAVTSSFVMQPARDAQAAQAMTAVDPTRGFSELVDRVMPAVVSVEVKFTNASAEGGSADEIPPQFKEFFEQFPQFRDRFGDRNQPRRDGSAMGSGFVISADGYVVTNNHVVRDATSVKLTFENGDEYDAKVVGTDPKTDLALLKIDAKTDLPFVSFTDSDAKVGDWVMAVGNPFGLGGTVTTGIVSARGRNIGSGPYDDFLQIDASINRGNSGGPAFNLEGEVIGVNTAIFSPSGGSVGIGFAIPANMVQEVVTGLKENGTVTRGWLGVRIQSLTPELAEGLGLSSDDGAIVSELTANSPAAEAGVKSGDTILKFNGKVIKNSQELTKTVAGVKPGSSIDLDIIRDGKPMTIKVKIGVLDDGATKKAAVVKADQTVSLASLGLEVEGTETGNGVRVTAVKPGSPAAERGIRQGDMILEVAGNEVSSPNDVTEAIKASDSKRVLMLVKQGEGQRFIALPKSQS